MAAVHPPRGTVHDSGGATKPRAQFPPPSPSRCDDRAPPSANKKLGYRAWFGAILFLEYALIRKAVQFLKVNEADNVTIEVSKNNLMAHPWFSILINVVTDGLVLWFLNAFPGVKECGVTRDTNKNRVLLVSEQTPILARHLIKMITRIQPVSSRLLGAVHVHHGYTLKQTLLMIVSPTFFNVAFGGTDVRFLSAMAAVNVGAALLIAHFNWFAYGAFTEVVGPAFFRQMGSGEDFYQIGVPVVCAAPFVFAFLARNESVKNGCDLVWRANSFLYFGDTNTVVPVAPSPGMIMRIGTRLRVVAERVIPVAVVVNAVAVANAAGFPFKNGQVGDNVSRDGHAPPGVLIFALLIASVWAPTRTVSTFFSTPKEWRAFNENARAASERAALSVVAPYAACTAAALSVAARSGSFHLSPQDVSNLAFHVWLPAWGVIALCATAVAPSPGPGRAARAAFVGVAIAIAGVVAIDDVAFRAACDIAFAQLRKIAPQVLLPAYLCVLHASTVWGVCAAFLGESPTNEGWIEANAAPAHAAPGSQNHWRVEDFEIDPSRFELRDVHQPLRENHARFTFVPLGFAEPITQTERDAAVDAARERARFATARVSSTRAPRCRAANCEAAVDKDNVLCAGLTLCTKHLLTDEPFRCTLRGGTAHFCVQCRRVHAPPRCGEGEGETEAPLRGGNVRYPPLRTTAETHSLRRRERGGGRQTRAPRQNLESRDVAMRAWYKTDEGPLEATARMRDVIADFAAAKPGGARVLHAEACARPGCTLLTVDISGRLDDDAVSSTGASLSNGFDEDEEIESEKHETARTRRVDDVTRAFQDAGVRHGLDGVLDFDFDVVDPGSGETASPAGSGRRRRLTFDRKSGRSRHVQGTDKTAAAHFSSFEQFRTFGAFGAETRDAQSRYDAQSKIPILRSDKFDFLTLPLAPDGYEYVLRCGGTYILMRSFRCDGAQRRGTKENATQIAHVTPTNAEGLGFVELVASSDLTRRDSTRGHAHDDLTTNIGKANSAHVSPLFSATVFLTSDAALARELDHPVNGARAEHAPIMFNIGAALTGRASGAVVGRRSGDCEKVRQETVFHAACASASMGWSVALGRVLKNLDASAARDDGSTTELRSGMTYCSSMSEAPDTATDDFSSDASVEFRNAEFGKNKNNTHGKPSLRKPPGAAMLPLLRAACSSGDAKTTRLVLAWVICNYGAVAAGDLLVTGDGAGGVGGGDGWTPTHCAAAAVARLVRDRPSNFLANFRYLLFGAKKGLAQTVIETLVISADPLSWVASRTKSPSFVARSNLPTRDAEKWHNATKAPVADVIATLAKQHELHALDEIVRATLASATRDAVEYLRLSKFGVEYPWQTGGFGAETELGAKQGGGKIGKSKNDKHTRAPLSFYEHFAAASALASFHYDGTPISTMAVALLSPGSARAWDALRARSLDTARGSVSVAEATAWVSDGAPSAGFPTATPQDLCTHQLGPKFVTRGSTLDFVSFLLVFFGSYAETSVLTWALVFAVHFASPLTGVAARDNARTRQWCYLVATVASAATMKHTGPGRKFGVTAIRAARVFSDAIAAPAPSFVQEMKLVALGFVSCVPLVLSDFSAVSENCCGRTFLGACVLTHATTWLSRRCAAIVAETAHAKLDGDAKKRKMK